VLISKQELITKKIIIIINYPLYYTHLNKQVYPFKSDYPIYMCQYRNRNGMLIYTYIPYISALTHQLKFYILPIFRGTDNKDIPPSYLSFYFRSGLIILYLAIDIIAYYIGRDYSFIIPLQGLNRGPWKLILKLVPLI